MKAMAMKFLVLSLLICIISISSADNARIARSSGLVNALTHQTTEIPKNENKEINTYEVSKSRSKRGIVDAGAYLAKGAYRVVTFPFTAIFFFITLPFRIILFFISLPFRILYTIIMFPIRLITGDDGSTYTLSLSDENTEKITKVVLTTAWEFIRDTGLPQLDSLAKRFKDNDKIPQQYRDMLSRFDSFYQFMKIVGVLK